MQRTLAGGISPREARMVGSKHFYLDTFPHGTAINSTAMLLSYHSLLLVAFYDTQKYIWHIPFGPNQYDQCPFSRLLRHAGHPRLAYSHSPDQLGHDQRSAPYWNTPRSGD